MWIWWCLLRSSFLHVAEFEHLPRPNEKKRALFYSNFKVEVVGLSWVQKRRYGFTIYFSERFQNHTLCWNHRKSYALSKAYDFGTILLFSSISTRRTTYSLIKLARKVGTVHTKIVLDYDSRRVSVSRTRRRCFFPLNFFDHLNSSLNPRSTQ